MNVQSDHQCTVLVSWCTVIINENLTWILDPISTVKQSPYYMLYPIQYSL